MATKVVINLDIEVSQNLGHYQKIWRSYAKFAGKANADLWSSCSRKYQRINQNYYLYKAPVACVEYVILYELLHFIYPKHDKGFHETLTVLMPDWQERKRLLDYEIVLGV